MTHAYMHFRLDFGAITAAIRVEDIPGKDDYQCASVAVSYCSPGDNFSRYRGRQLAIEKMNRGEIIWSETIRKEGKIKAQVVDGLLTSALDPANRPQWVRQWIQDILCSTTAGAVEFLKHRPRYAAAQS